MGAFTLFITAYEEVRTAVQYLRRKQGDADSIAPSLYLSRGLRKKPVDEPAAPVPPVVTQPGTPTLAANAPGNNAPVTPATSTVGNHGPFVD